MRQLARFVTFLSLVTALVITLPPVSARGSDEEPAQAAPKKLLFLTYPGVGQPGTHGHDSLPNAERMAVEYGKTGGFEVTVLKGYEPGVGNNDVKFLNADYLASFDGLMLMTNGEWGWTLDQKKLVVEWVRQGKGFIGVHCATVQGYDYPPYGEMIGAYYFNSIATPLVAATVPLTQRRFGVLKVEDTSHPATRMLHGAWPIAEEFYTFATAPWTESQPEANLSSPGNFKAPMGFSRERVHVLLSLDTDHTNIDGYVARAGVKKGGDYPQAWWRLWGEGRVFYTSLGHVADTWTNDAVFRAHLTGGIRWALGLEK